MTYEERNPNSGDAQRDNAPPPQHPPPYDEGVPELAGNASSSSAQQGDVKRDASAYAGSYRPGESQASQSVCERRFHYQPIRL